VDAYGFEDTVDRASVEAYYGTPDDDQFKGNGGNGTNALYSADFYGLDGDDTLVGSGLAETLDGGDGNDTIWGLGDADAISGGDGNDKLYGEQPGGLVQGAPAGADTISGGAGNDIIDGGKGDDSIDGGDDNDTINWAFGDGSDTIAGGSGSDLLVVDLDNGIAGQTEPATITYRGGESASIAVGADTIDLTEISNIVVDLDPDGDPDDVTEDGSLSDNDISVVFIAGSIGLADQPGTDDDDVIYGSKESDILLGFRGDDWIVARDGDDTVRGGEGDDRLDGGDGSDTLIGNLGNDILVSGAGIVDIAYGGEGADTHVFGAELGNGIQELDIIQDHDVLEDLIDLGGETVGRHVETESSVVLWVGADEDIIVVNGATSFASLGLPSSEDSVTAEAVA
jgi:Ca2+-binding RTX toxin-like protein